MNIREVHSPGKYTYKIFCFGTAGIEIFVWLKFLAGVSSAFEAGGSRIFSPITHSIVLSLSLFRLQTFIQTD
jgi:uncharacterized membrane protein